MKTYFTVTGIVKNRNKILILKKSAHYYNYPNRWSFCSGYVKEFESAEDTVLREIKEETGLNAKIAKRGRLLQVHDKNNGKNWVMMVFLCEVKSSNVKLDHENAKFRWINYNDIKKYNTVPGLQKDLKVLGLI